MVSMGGLSQPLLRIAVGQGIDPDDLIHGEGLDRAMLRPAHRQKGGVVFADQVPLHHPLAQLRVEKFHMVGGGVGESPGLEVVNHPLEIVGTHVPGELPPERLGYVAPGELIAASGAAPHVPVGDGGPGVVAVLQGPGEQLWPRRRAHGLQGPLRLLTGGVRPAGGDTVPYGVIGAFSVSRQFIDTAGAFGPGCMFSGFAPALVFARSRGRMPRPLGTSRLQRA